MVLALLVVVVVVEAEVLGLMQAIQLPPATDHPLEEELVFMG